MHYLSILSTLVTAVFAAAVLNRYRYKRGNHLLMWGIGLVLYGFGTLTEVIMSFTYHPAALKIWYVSGAMLTAAWLGQGTVFLLVRKRGIAPALTVILGIVTLLAVSLVASAPLDPAAAAAYDVSQPISGQYKEIMVRSGPVIALTILLNVYGTIALVGGAIYSSYLFWRKKVLASRMFGNLLIAGGALLPAMAGTFVKAGMVDWLYPSEFLGVVLMYAGFLQATAGKPAEKPAAAAIVR